MRYGRRGTGRTGGPSHPFLTSKEKQGAFRAACLRKAPFLLWRGLHEAAPVSYTHLDVYKRQNLPQVGDAVTAGEAFADVESVKAVSDVYSPVTGTVCEINEALLDAPESINQDPYGAWFIRVENAVSYTHLVQVGKAWMTKYG